MLGGRPNKLLQSHDWAGEAESAAGAGATADAAAGEERRRARGRRRWTRICRRGMRWHSRGKLIVAPNNDESEVDSFPSQS